ncbi:MAG: (Fe-S)-binding protein [Candidatus Rokuibacteriota bacterium]
MTVGAFTGSDVPDLNALRSCVHCGICLPQCPTYRVLGEEMDSPRGRLYLIRAVAEGRLDITDTFVRHMDLCLGCRACETACPAGVPFGRLLETARAQIERRGRPVPARAFGALLLGLFPHPGRVAWALGGARLYRRSGLQRVVRRAGVLRRFPRLAALDALLDNVPDEAPMPEFVAARGRARGRVGLLLGCVQRHVNPDVHRDTARLLALAGWEVVIPRAQGCCGALELHAGRADAYRARARALAAAFPEDLEWIVTNAAGCGAAMREYPHWLDASGVARLAARTRDVTELLADAELPLGPLPLTVTYHDACHLAHGQKVRAAPRRLLARIPGLTLVELADSDLCCGSAGVYNVQEPAMADALLALKVDRIVETGAGTVVAGNPGCLLQIAKGMRERGLGVEVVHPVSLVARAVRT